MGLGRPGAAAVQNRVPFYNNQAGEDVLYSPQTNRSERCAMFFIGPMTGIVVLVLAICLAVGLAALAHARSARRAGRQKVCTQCRNVNPPRAAYCAYCGRALDS
jgi:hypothetical protein